MSVASGDTTSDFPASVSTGGEGSAMVGDMQYTQRQELVLHEARLYVADEDEHCVWVVEDLLADAPVMVAAA